MTNTRAAAILAGKKDTIFNRLWKQRSIQAFMIAWCLWNIAMRYVPMLGNVIAFENYLPNKGFLHSNWVGLKHFKSFFTNDTTLILIRNTIAMSFLSLFFGTIMSVAFALLLNEIYHQAFKRTIQSISYLPYFISMAVCANLFIMFLSRTGPLNEALRAIGIIREDIPFLEKEGLFWLIITIQSVWKDMGWNAIIYMAAITGIDYAIYEAAFVDGAGRFRRIWHITLPAILPTMAVLLTMGAGSLIMGGFEQQLLMFNPIVMDYAEVISTYVYKRGIGGAQYSFASAVGICQSIVSILVLILVNKASKKLTETSLW